MDGELGERMKWNGEDVPDVYPPDEEVLHEEGFHCECGPRVETKAIPSIGCSTAWIQHRTLIVVPDVLPEDWDL